MSNGHLAVGIKTNFNRLTGEHRHYVDSIVCVYCEKRFSRNFVAITNHLRKEHGVYWFHERTDIKGIRVPLDSLGRNTDNGGDCHYGRLG